MTHGRRFAVGRSGLGLAVVALALAFGVVAAGCTRAEEPSKATAATGPRPLPVTVATVEQRDVPVTIAAVGNAQAVATVAVLSQVTAQIVKVHFVEGQDVRAGQLLFTLDPRSFEAALAQAEANLRRDQAQVKQAEAALGQRRADVQQAEANLARDQAQLEMARTQEQRYQDLASKEFVAREQADQMRTNASAMTATVRADQAAIANARAAAQAAEANLETARAAVHASEAAVDTARVQLSYTRITAPSAGRTGNLLIHEGNVVKASDVGNPLVTINPLDPIYVTFGVPEQYLDQIQRFRREGTLRVEVVGAGAPGRTIGGRVVFINNAVDASTGMIQLKAEFPNRDVVLWPGQFTNVAVTLTTVRGAVVVPNQAIQTGQKGTYVFVVKPDSTVDLRPVTTALVVDRYTVIEKGVAAGDRVVTDGQLRLAPGAKVEIKPAQPSS